MARPEMQFHLPQTSKRTADDLLSVGIVLHSRLAEMCRDREKKDFYRRAPELLPHLLVVQQCQEILEAGMSDKNSLLKGLTSTERQFLLDFISVGTMSIPPNPCSGLHKMNLEKVPYIVVDGKKERFGTRLRVWLPKDFATDTGRARICGNAKC